MATNEFSRAARAQAAQLGRPDFDAIYVRHPIQDQTADEVRKRADETIDEIVARLTNP